MGAYSVQKEKFKLNVTYQSDSTGTYVNYLPEGNCANQILIRVLGLDRLDTYDNPNPDGFFDFIIRREFTDLIGLAIIDKTKSDTQYLISL